ncbi:procathepsin L-like [Macrotis lagotis]|uniref:procathepsin L-like n=1 Tax=Macrotis lagotis TaxID=92651 RepID=UPI003D6802EC
MGTNLFQNVTVFNPSSESLPVSSEPVWPILQGECSSQEVECPSEFCSSDYTKTSSGIYYESNSSSWCLNYAILVMENVDMETIQRDKSTKSLRTGFNIKKSLRKLKEQKEEESFRRNVWEKTLKLIKDHNQQYKKGKQSYYMGMNAYGDRTDKELRRKLSTQVSPRARKGSSSQFFPIVSDLPKSLDWRKYGFMTPVRQQGICNACWAFCTLGALEGQYFLKSGRLVELSKQQLIDCSEFSDCDGGYIIDTYQYIIQNGGITTESCYPYTKQKNWWCDYKSRCEYVTMKNYVILPRGDEEILMRAVATIGPVSVSIHTPRSFYLYQGGHLIQRTFFLLSLGLYMEPDCDSNSVNYGLLLVGYGDEEGENTITESKVDSLVSCLCTRSALFSFSLGEEWGEEGYMRIAKDMNNHCGIANEASYPIL